MNFSHAVNINIVVTPVLLHLHVNNHLLQHSPFVFKRKRFNLKDGYR